MFREGRNRGQVALGTLDNLVAEGSIARVVDAIVDSMDLCEMGFDRTESAQTGRPAYEAGQLLKLYIYGHLEGIRSSRKLERACQINIEVIWLMRGLQPDFRTIAEFRRRNAERMKDVFKTFDRKVFEVLLPGFVSVDGTKIQANCAMKNVFMKENVEDTLNRLAVKIAKYMSELDKADEAEEKEDESDADASFTREQIEKELGKLEERRERYTRYRDYMEQNGLTQMSVTDADARMMKKRDGFGVCYNVQAAVDSETDIIREVEVTNQCTDHGLLGPTALAVKESDTILEAAADKGYIQPEDMAACLENGVIPHVIPKHGSDHFELEIPYQEAEITEETRKSTEADDLAACLHAGVIPEAYENVICKVETEVVYRSEEKDPADAETPASPYLSEDEARARAAQGFFVRNPETNTVICPGGHTLPQKSVRKNGNICYACRGTCKACEHRDKCLTKHQNFREIEFSKDTLEKPNKQWQKAENDGFAPQPPRKRGKLTKQKIVRIFFRPDAEKMSRRKELSEHPFGTLKRTLNAGYFLLRGKAKVQGEAALSCLAYNVRRTLNLLGFDRLMALFA